MNRKNRIDELIEILENANESYYNDAESEISDEEYDNLKDELRKLAPKHPFLLQVGQKVSKSSEWKKAKHKISMTSLNKVNLEDEFKKWAKETGSKYFIIEEKLDGGSADLEYEVNLIDGITRGDGIEGDSITPNIVRMQNVKAKIDNFNGSLRGEIIILAEDFEKINKILESEGVKTLANARNGAVGISKRLDGRFSKDLTILYYDITGIDFKTEFDKMEYIKNVLKLKTSFYKRVTIDEAIEVYNDYVNKLRAELDHEIDGLVIKVDDIATQENLGLLGSNPRGQIAWKFPPITKVARVLDVKWHVGNMRHVTPIIHIEPTKIGGVTVSKMNCHNLDIFTTKFNLYKGCKLLFKRSNDVIPVPLKVIEEEVQKEKTFLPPTHCPECNARLEIEGKFLTCPNDNCTALQTGNLEKWIGGLEIMDIGGKIIEALHKTGKVNEPADFYKLKVSDIANLEGLGEKSANKILKNLHDKKQLTLPEFIGNLNMRNFSKSRVETLVEAGYDSIEKLQTAKVEDIAKVGGFKDKTAQCVINGLKSKQSVIRNLLDIGITIKEIEKVQIKSNKLKGLSFVFTGGIEKRDINGNRYTRPMMEALVIENEGQICSVTKGLSFLVQVDPTSTSSKSQKANILGIKILSENDFFKMLGM